MFGAVVQLPKVFDNDEAVLQSLGGSQHLKRTLEKMQAKKEDKEVEEDGSESAQPESKRRKEKGALNLSFNPNPRDPMSRPLLGDWAPVVSKLIEWPAEGEATILASALYHGSFDHPCDYQDNIPSVLDGGDTLEIPPFVYIDSRACAVGASSQRKTNAFPKAYFDRELPKRISTRYTGPSKDLQDLEQLFEEQPMWSLNRIGERMGKEPSKELLKAVCYRFDDGPWRNLYTRYNYNARDHPESRMFQIVQLRNESGKIIKINIHDAAEQSPQVARLVETHTTAPTKSEGWFTKSAYAEIKTAIATDVFKLPEPKKKVRQRKPSQPRQRKKARSADAGGNDQEEETAIVIDEADAAVEEPESFSESDTEPHMWVVLCACDSFTVWVEFWLVKKKEEEYNVWVSLHHDAPAPPPLLDPPPKPLPLLEDLLEDRLSKREWLVFLGDS